MLKDQRIIPFRLCSTHEVCRSKSWYILFYLYGTHEACVHVSVPCDVCRSKSWYIPFYLCGTMKPAYTCLCHAMSAGLRAGTYHSITMVPMNPAYTCLCHAMSAGPRAGTYHSISVVPMKPVYTCLCHAMSAGPRAGTADRDGAGSCGHSGELRRCHVLHPHEEHPSGRVGQDHRHQLQGRMLV